MAFSDCADMKAGLYLSYLHAIYSDHLAAWPFYNMVAKKKYRIVLMRTVLLHSLKCTRNYQWDTNVLSLSEPSPTSTPCACEQGRLWLD